MKIRVLLLSFILALTSLSVSAQAQGDQQKTPPSNQTSQQPASQPAQQPVTTQQQPASAQQQPATSQQQPANTTSQQPASDQTQAPATAASAQDQAPAGDQDSDKDKDKKDKKEKKIKHDGSKNDVDAIGNRKLGGMDWYSTESEIKMGKQYAQQIEQSMKLVQDPVVNEYVNRVGQNLVRNSDAKVPFTIKVVDADEINAMALPGGFFYVNSGLILAADDEAELAGVMAHEIAHVAARHATRGATRSQLANIMTIPLIFVGGRSRSSVSPVDLKPRRITWACSTCIRRDTIPMSS
jgi:beta-barrel assembly-enhancing protease